MSTALKMRPCNTIRLAAPKCALRWAAFLAALGAVTVAVTTSLDRFASPATLALAAAAGDPVADPFVIATDVRGEREVGYVTVIGSAARAHEAAAGPLEVVVELLDARGRLAAVGAALLPEAVALRRSAPFCVTLADAPGAAGFQVTFRSLSGRPLPASVAAHSGR